MSLNLSHLAMYRYNFWPKAFLPPAPGMDNASFVPNPALMVLASTAAEGREPPRLPGPPHPFSGQPMEGKDLSQHPPPFSSAGFVYRPGEPFPAPLYAPMPPFVRPDLERSMGLMGPRGGAFRQLGPHEGVEPYHSAFTPAKKSKLENASSAFASDSAEHGFDKDSDSKKSHSPSIKEERPSSISSAGGDTNSEIHSDNGDLYDRGTPDSEGRSLRRSRKRTVDGHVPCCPICGLTLRPGETEAHLAVELDKLERICRGGRKSRDSTPSGRKTLPSPSGRKGKDSPSPEAASRSRFESYLRIRCNRQTRLNARSRNKKRRMGEETVCPVCSERLSGSPEELNGHVEMCLKRRQGEGEEEPVDVEGDGEQYEEYTWAGQTRIRATTMLEGGFAGSGFQTSNSKRTSEDEGDLNVDGDDSEEYGRPQFTEGDLVRLGPDERGPNVQQASTSTSTACYSTNNQLQIPVESATDEPMPGTSQSEPLDLCQSESLTNAGQKVLVSALKSRLKEMESCGDAKQKCLICMNQYQEPLVSIQCWHVHCEQCWFQTLGAKKLCPQCNMITSPSDLRRIFL